MSEYFRSESNQPFISEIKIGVIGPGTVFGETDVFFGRNNIYSVKSITPNSSYFQIKAEDFLKIIS